MIQTAGWSARTPSGPCVIISASHLGRLVDLNECASGRSIRLVVGTVRDTHIGKNILVACKTIVKHSFPPVEPTRETFLMVLTRRSSLTTSFLTSHEWSICHLRRRTREIGNMTSHTAGRHGTPQKLTGALISPTHHRTDGTWTPSTQRRGRRNVYCRRIWEALSLSVSGRGHKGRQSAFPELNPSTNEYIAWS